MQNKGETSYIRLISATLLALIPNALAAFVSECATERATSEINFVLMPAYFPVCVEQINMFFFVGFFSSSSRPGGRG